jgi:transposase
MHQYRQALVRLRAGDTDREIARSKLMGRDKVARFRALASDQGWLEGGAELPDDAALAAVLGAARRARSTVSSVEPYRALVQRWCDASVQGKAIHAALCREHGYRGSYSSVARMLASMRAARPPEVTVRLTFNPGEAAQVDFGAGPMLMHPDGRPRRTWAFVMTLCHSRHQYVEFVWDQTVATWLGCHRRAFDWFGGVPSRVIIDNPKCAVTRACVHDPLVQRAYAGCAEGYGFRIDPCPPADPQKKGIVESGVKYVKRNFLPLRAFRDLPDLNAQARAWVMTEAGERLHGTTRVAPLTLFALERPLLRPLPAVAPDLGTWHRVTVHRDCHVQFERALYSVPFILAGKVLWLRATDVAVSVFEDYRHVTTHLRARHPGERRTVRDHLPPEAQAFFAHDRAWCLNQAARIGPACTTLVTQLLGDRIVERLRAAQGVLRLVERYGPERCEAACTRALAHDSPHYRTVKTILAGGHDREALVALDEAAVYVDRPRFARDAQSLFHPNPQPDELH